MPSGCRTTRGSHSSAETVTSAPPGTACDEGKQAGTRQLDVAPHLPQVSRGQPAPPPFAGHQGHAFRSASSRVTLVTVALGHSVQGEEGPAASMPPGHLHTRDFLHRGGSPQPGECRGERPAAEPHFQQKESAQGGRPGGEAAHCLVRVEETGRLPWGRISIRCPYNLHTSHH